MPVPTTTHRIRHYVYGVPGDRSTMIFWTPEVVS